jgi:hypothetical protein
MKQTKLKLSVFLMVVAIAVSGLSSCNKKLKKDVKDLDQQVADLQAQQAQTNNTIGFPFTMALTTTDAASAPVSVNKTYKFWTGTDYCYMGANGDGTYYFYIEITEAANWDLEGYMYGDYDPTTNTVANGGVYLTYYDSNWNTMQPQFYQSDANATLNFTVNTFNTTTGAVDIKVVASTNASSTYNIYTGKPMSATFTTAGKLGAGFN